MIVWINAFVEMVTLTFLSHYAAIYFNAVLGFSIATTGTVVNIVILKENESGEKDLC